MTEDMKPHITHIIVKIMGGGGGGGERSKLSPPLADQYLDRDMKSLEQGEGGGGVKGEMRWVHL